ncbi:hypothetical protein ACFV0T_20790 [Streptomyces sp. NPDC059582]|uniref:hypothetical protein n=1 Tax=Streptomyces sp. NPDC059582 TaxID=3346875 RepID=UPI00369A13BC
MTPRPSRHGRVLASVLAAGTLLTSAACSDDNGGDSGGSDATASPSATESAGAGNSASPSATAALTQALAQSALITEADLEDAWTQAKDAGGWKDSLLIGKVDAAQFLTGKTAVADCQRLLDGLYGDDLLGKPSGASAVVGFTEGDSRLRQQVAAYAKGDLDKSMTWLKNLPDTCDQFTVTGSGGDRSVEVVATSLPKAADSAQALTVTVRGSTDGTPVTLTLDVAASRVGSDAVTVTNGGLDGADHDSTADAVVFGTQHLKDVLAGKSPAPTPSQIE